LPLPLRFSCYSKVSFVLELKSEIDREWWRSPSDMESSFVWLLRE
jgi:hypothetical protein